MGCRGTQGYREEMSEVPTNIEFTVFYIIYFTGCHVSFLSDKGVAKSFWS